MNHRVISQFLCFVLVTVALFHALPVEAKRRGPPQIAPIFFDEWTIRVVREKTEQTLAIFVEARKADSPAAPVWRTELYQVKMDPLLETDVQEVPVTQLRLEGQTLKVRDSLGRAYKLDASSGRKLP